MIERLIILACATWYLSYAVTNTDGLFGMFNWLRENWPKWAGGRSVKPVIIVSSLSHEETIKILKDGLLDCIICTSFWVGIGLSLIAGGGLLTGIAAAGLSLMLHRFTGWAYSPQS